MSPTRRAFVQAAIAAPALTLLPTVTPLATTATTPDVMTGDHMIAIVASSPDETINATALITNYRYTDLRTGGERYRCPPRIVIGDKAVDVTDEEFAVLLDLSRQIVARLLRLANG